MDTYLKADFFFFITGIAVIIVTILLAIIGVYLIIILGHLRYISRKARVQAEHFEKDIEDARDYIKENGVSIRTLLKIKDFFIPSNKRKKDNQ